MNLTSPSKLLKLIKYNNNNNNNNSNNNNNNTKPDVYGVVIMAQPLPQFTRFT